MLKRYNKIVQICVLLLSTAIFCLFSCSRIMALENNTPIKKAVQQNRTGNANLVKKRVNNKQGRLLVKNKQMAGKKNNNISIKKSVPVISEKAGMNRTVSFCMPVSGTITSQFGYRKLTMQDGSVSAEIHKGLDIAAAEGTQIHAAFGGTVKFAGVQQGYGNTIIISHANGLETLYGHCSKLTAKIGQQIKKGDEIAKVGSTGRSTGPHVHFEVRLNGEAVNPVKYIGNGSITEN